MIVFVNPMHQPTHALMRASPMVTGAIAKEKAAEATRKHRFVSLVSIT